VTRVGGADGGLRTIPTVRVAAACIVATCLGAGIAPGAGAEGPTWSQTATVHCVVRYQPGSEAARDVVVSGADAIYSALASAFEVGLAEPVLVRVHPTFESYARANPVVVSVDGVLAGSRHGRREVEVIADPGSARGDESVLNDLRAELGRVLVAAISADRLPDLLVQGVAQYAQRPDDALASSVARLRDAWSRDALPGLDALTAPGATYVDPPVTQAASRALVQYLVDRFGFPALLDFARATATASGWRAAFEATYGAAPETVEAEWRLWLPAYLDGSWRHHALYEADLSAVESLVARGEYAAAERVLRTAGVMVGGGDAAGASRVEALRGRVASGIRAQASLGQAEAALAAGDYAAAAEDAARASEALGALGAVEAARAGREIARRARTGLTASSDLDRARRLATWRVLEARALAGEAARAFALLGNDASRDRARDLARVHDRRLSGAGVALAAAGAALLAWNVRRRRRDAAAGAP
jgi:hypothetical protein